MRSKVKKVQRVKVVKFVAMNAGMNVIQQNNMSKNVIF